jgi:hypothetical protein
MNEGGNTIVTYYKETKTDAIVIYNGERDIYRMATRKDEERVIIQFNFHSCAYLGYCFNHLSLYRRGTQ